MTTENLELQKLTTQVGYRGNKVAIVIPCYNEELAVKEVVTSFKNHIPEAIVYVFDNNSTDRTVEYAKSAGAEVRTVTFKGKGNVVRRMFSDVEADIYVMVDGDDTYDAASVYRLIDKLLDEHLDMVVGRREESADKNPETYRHGHRLGNRVLTGAVMNIFGGSFTDMLSGYRAFSRRYVKSFPALAKGFETETELTVHALELRMPYGEVSTPYGSRPEGSESKLSTYKDGFKILKTIINLYVSERPFMFFSLISLFLCIISLLFFSGIFIEYIQTGLVPRLPTAVLSMALMLSSIISFFSGLILNTVTLGRNETKRLIYLSIPETLPKD
ncbi:glycosyltransferase [Rahnella aceris]|jgi:glycosyltransferase involved in cell wall biosynthesis|uniref:glycosyltransferase n=1 Tax=Rahnella sp. (strain Y9602) TaxID=2703885 RepID=UPI000256BC5B|nr:glycosyltransferase [Rahnella aceris]AFE57946.1 family 2 glycosyl transferase [Rahnella aquatilis HX2]MBU9860400.1 glycosyltransferase [Rahnella aceris]